MKKDSKNVYIPQKEADPRINTVQKDTTNPKRAKTETTTQGISSRTYIIRKGKTLKLYILAPIAKNIQFLYTTSNGSRPNAIKTLFS